MDSKFSRHTGETKAIIDDFTQQIITNFRNQDEKLNKFTLSVSE